LRRQRVDLGGKPHDDRARRRARRFDCFGVSVLAGLRTGGFWLRPPRRFALRSCRLAFHLRRNSRSANRKARIARAPVRHSARRRSAQIAHHTGHKRPATECRMSHSAWRKPIGAVCASSNTAAVSGPPNTAPVSRFSRLPCRSGTPSASGVWPCTIMRP
jgi:hypothetical protein